MKRKFGTRIKRGIRTHHPIIQCSIPILHVGKLWCCGTIVVLAILDCKNQTTATSNRTPAQSPTTTLDLSVLCSVHKCTQPPQHKHKSSQTLTDLSEHWSLTSYVRSSKILCVNLEAEHPNGPASQCFSGVQQTWQLKHRRRRAGGNHRPSGAVTPGRLCDWILASYDDGKIRHKHKWLIPMFKRAICDI